METPYTVCAAVLAHVQDAFTLCGHPPWDPGQPSTPGIMGSVSVGGITVDDCCFGLLLVAPERVLRTVAPFPTDAGADAVCAGSPIGIEIVVRMDRCIETVDNQGRAPSLAVQQETFDQVLEDAAIIWNVVNSDEILGDDGYGDALWERANVVQTYAPPLGGCIGSETRLTLGIPSALWCGTC